MFSQLRIDILRVAARAPCWLLFLVGPALSASLPDANQRPAAEGLEAAPEMPMRSGYILAGQFPTKDAADAVALHYEQNGISTYMDRQRQASSLTTLYFGPFKRAEQAQGLLRQLAKHRIEAFTFEAADNLSVVVHVGAFSTPSAAEKHAQTLRSLGFIDFRLGRKQVGTDAYRVWADITEKAIPLNPRPRPLPTPDIAIPAPLARPTIMPPTLAPSPAAIVEAQIELDRGALLWTEPTAPLPNTHEPAPLLTGRTRSAWLVESRHWRQHDQPASALWLSGNYSVTASTPDGAFAFAAGVRGDYASQSAVRNLSTLSVDYLPSFVAYHDNADTWSLGFQRINWNRAPGDSSLDGLATRDLTYVLLDNDLERRRRPNAAIQWQHIEHATKLEVVWLPLFRPAELPDAGSVWHPINRERGMLRGLEDNTTLRELVRAGGVSDMSPTLSGGGGVRMTQTQGSRYTSYSGQRLRRSEPYFVLSDSVRASIQAGTPTKQALVAATGPTFDVIHTPTWLLGVEEGSERWHFEVAWSSAAPITFSNLSTGAASQATWQTSVKVTPNLPNVEHWLTLSGAHLLTKEDVLDRVNTLRISGNAQVTTADNDWHWGTRYLVGLDHVELHLNPYIMYVGLNNAEVNFGAHIFGGARLTEFGYHSDHNHIVLGWSSRY